MSMKDVTLVVTNNCPYCPSVDKLWNELKRRHSFNYKVVDAVSEEGGRLVEKFGILSVPATIIDGKLKFVGVPGKEKAEEAVM